MINEKITQPLGLTNTYVGNSDKTEATEASSYRFSGSWGIQPKTHMSVPHAAGAMISTALDTNQFFVSIFANKLISEASLKSMMTLQDNYGLGLFSVPFYEQTFYGHNGGIDGFVSSSGYNLKDGIAITILSNAVNFSFNDVQIAVASSIYGREFNIPDFSAKPTSVSIEAKSKLIGEFESDTFPLDLMFWLDGEHLMTKATGQEGFPLTSYSETEFRFDPAGIIIHFDADSESDGRLNKLILIQGGAKRPFKRK